MGKTVKKIKICHLYPDVLNLYGDMGNIICLKKRLEWRGIDCLVTRVGIGQKADFADFDIFFIGGGQDFEQEVLLADLKSGKDKELKSAIEDGKVVLAICGGYQMLGHYYETYEGVKCEFLGAIDFHTKGEKVRLIGNYSFELNEKLGGGTVVGFENHSGKTYLQDGISPLGTVMTGFGNNGMDKTEGVHYNNVFGTYSHGPVLPKNPEFADAILLSSVKRKYGIDKLEKLDDTVELNAKRAILGE